MPAECLSAFCCYKCTLKKSLNLQTDTANCFPFSRGLSKWCQKQQEQTLFPDISVVYEDTLVLLPLFLSLQLIGCPLFFSVKLLSIAHVLDGIYNTWHLHSPYCLLSLEFEYLFCTNTLSLQFFHCSLQLLFQCVACFQVRSIALEM